MNARDIKHTIRRIWCLEEAKNGMPPDCFVLLNYCTVEDGKQNKTKKNFSLRKEYTNCCYRSGWPVSGLSSY